ncbi:hypothetical protein ON010_g15086 [Phytophthora cinnamomi]|nr:hypothetical protein ON010_g15086 [Phytophthora cinnamomi]
MGGTESNEVAKDDARLQHPMVIRSPPAQQQPKQDKKPEAAKQQAVAAQGATVVAMALGGFIAIKPDEDEHKSQH